MGGKFGIRYYWRRGKKVSICFESLNFRRHGKEAGQILCDAAVKQGEPVNTHRFRCEPLGPGWLWWRCYRVFVVGDGTVSECRGERWSWWRRSECVWCLRSCEDVQRQARVAAEEGAVEVCTRRAEATVRQLV